MVSATSESPSTSTSKRLRRSSTPASAIGSRTSTRGRSGIPRGDGRVRLERAGPAGATLDLCAGLQKRELDGRERGDDVEDVVVADVADAEKAVLKVAVAPGAGDAGPVATRAP